MRFEKKIQSTLDYNQKKKILLQYNYGAWDLERTQLALDPHRKKIYFVFGYSTTMMLYLLENIMVLKKINLTGPSPKEIYCCFSQQYYCGAQNLILCTTGSIFNRHSPC